jgi:hypothetical protein
MPTVTCNAVALLDFHVFRLYAQGYIFATFVFSLQTKSSADINTRS